MNSIWSIQLENVYSQLKSYQSAIKNNEIELQNLSASLNSIKNNMNDEERVKFDLLCSLHNNLTKECLEMENNISILKSRKSYIENEIMKDNNLLKMEMTRQMNKLSDLKQQKFSLVFGQNDEKANLLAQIKRDQSYIQSTQIKINQLEKTIEDIRNEIAFYKDNEKLANFSNLKQKEKQNESFLLEFASEKENLLQKLESVRSDINDNSNKIARCGKYVNMLQQLGQPNG